MEKNGRQEAHSRLVKAMLAGKCWPEAAAATELFPIKRAMAYRLVRAARTRGDAALHELLVLLFTFSLTRVTSVHPASQKV